MQTEPQRTPRNTENTKGKGKIRGFSIHHSSFIIFLCVLCGEKSSADAAFDPRAVALLDRMSAAYSRLKALDQRTEFSAEIIPFDAPDSPFGIPQKPTKKDTTKTKKKDAPPDAADGAKADRAKEQAAAGRKMRLRYAFPNRLRIETEEPGAAGDKPVRSVWDSDGKFFWTTIPEKNWYTKEKAPARLADFRKLERLNASSLETLMLLGVNPFANLREQCDALTWEGADMARDGAVDVVALRSDSRAAETVAKLYIGQADFLLRRVVIETTPAVGPATPGKIGDALDELAPEDPNPAPPLQNDGPADSPAALLDAPLPAAPAGARPTKTRITYENRITLNPIFNYDAFEFIIPPDALRFGTDAATKPKTRKPVNLMRRRKRFRVPNP